MNAQLLLHGKIVHWCLRSVSKERSMCVRLLLLLCKRERHYCVWLRWYVCVSGIISCFIISNGFTALAVASVPGAAGQECVCLWVCGYSPEITVPV